MKYYKIKLQLVNSFQGYLNNPEETSQILTDDGWVKTGDIFYRDEENYYYFVERKRLLIKYTGFWVSIWILSFNRNQSVSKSNKIEI